jgi:hypothetical protein
MSVSTITAARTAASMADQLSAKVVGERIELTLRAENGRDLSFRLNHREALALLTSIGKMASLLPSHPNAPPGARKAVLKVKRPAFRVGINPDGGVVLAIEPYSFPALVFEFDFQGVSKLMEGLEFVASIPNLRSAGAREIIN